MTGQIEAYQGTIPVSQKKKKKKMRTLLPQGIRPACDAPVNAVGVRGSRVCAGDISTASDFQIVNPELHLATLDSPDVSLSIEFNVESGKGYQQVTQGDSASGLPVGVLPVDAIYNPVRRVEYSVERMMVGQQTDWERLILQVWTDGAITPLAAIQEASENLVQHFFMFNQLSRPGDVALDTANLSVASEVYLMPIERLDLSSRTLNCLKRAKLDRVGQVLDLSTEDLLNIRNFGQKSLEELQAKLAELGVSSSGPGEDLSTEPGFAEEVRTITGGSLVFDPDDDDLDYDEDGE